MRDAIELVVATREPDDIPAPATSSWHLSPSLARASLYIRHLVLQNFRCFGSERVAIDLAPGLTALIGANGSGKTAVFHALLRLFGVTNDTRRVRRGDFHVPNAETSPAQQRSLVVEAILEFPELSAGNAVGTAVPEFFRHMAAEASGVLRCRIRLDATWEEDGSAEGAVEERRRVVTTFEEQFQESDCVNLTAVDRARVQCIYVPALRDGASQVTAFLRGRLWRAVQWSSGTRSAHHEAGEALRGAFAAEPGVAAIELALATRWAELHAAGTETQPLLRPMDDRFDTFVRRSEMVFHPGDAGRDRGVEDLSDGQRSLLHLALVATTLDVERALPTFDPTHFDAEAVAPPALTVIAVEEPENTLRPFYLARIVRQLQDLSQGESGQALVSSHSASMLSRIPPSDVRHFSTNAADRTSTVRPIRLPEGDEDASKFVREAVHIFPELYFARFVVLGEGSTEEVVLPRVADAMGLPVDRSFVAIVPLGGRHVNHLWRLLSDLGIPHVTLLDLDLGRWGGGWGRIKTAYQELLEIGLSPTDLFGTDLSGAALDDHLKAIGGRANSDRAGLQTAVTQLRSFGVFFSEPLDLDWSMLRAFPAAYMTLADDMAGPSQTGDAKAAALGDRSTPALYSPADDESFRWYRYLFIGRGKPSTHVRVLRAIDDVVLRDAAPEAMRALLSYAAERVAVPAASTRA